MGRKRVIWIIVKCEAWMNETETGYGLNYIAMPEHYYSRSAAIRAGYELFGHDDFNVAELVDGRLSRFFWMHRDMREPPEVMQEIARQLAMEVAA